MEINWKEHIGDFGNKIYFGWVGKICLFQYSYCYINREDKNRPYILQLFIGRTEHTYRYPTAEDCQKYAEKMLKFIKGQLK